MRPIRRIGHDEGFVEIGDRCWVARYSLLDVNVGVVRGERGLLVIDTSTSEAAAHRVVEQLRPLGAPVVSVVNTHAHYDHVFGNAVFASTWPELPLVAHEEAARRIAEAGEQAKELYQRSSQADDSANEILSSRIHPPTDTFSSVHVVDLGDRIVEVSHLGRGHTGGDAVLRVPDADVVYAGDLVEESGDGGPVPGFGEDCFPLEWPTTLDLLGNLVGPDTVLVPGHGMPVGRDFLLAQRDTIGTVAETIRDLAGRGVRPADLASAADWPIAARHLRHAFTRGFAQLPPGGRSLPLA